MSIALSSLAARPQPRLVDLTLPLAVGVVAGLLAVYGWNLFAMALMAVLFLFLPLSRPKVFLLFLAATGGQQVLTLTWGAAFTSELGGLNPSSFAFFLTVLTLSLVILLRLRQSTPWSSLRWHLVFVLYATCSIIWTPDLLYAARFLPKILFPLLIILAVRLYLPVRDLPQFEKAMLAGGLFTAVTGPIIAVLGLNPVMSAGGSAHMYSGALFQGAPLFGAYASMLALYCLVQWHFERRPKYLFLFLLFALNAAATLGRMVTLALLVSISVSFFLTARGAKRYLRLAAVFVLAVVLVTTFEPLKRRTFFSPESVTLLNIWDVFARFNTTVNSQGRFFQWAALVNDNLANPVRGSGAGSIDRVLRVTFPLRGIEGYSVPHNEYLRVLIDFGIVGVLLYLFAIGAYFRLFYREFRDRSRPVLVRKYSMLAIVALTYYMLFSITDNSFDYWSNLGFYAFAFAGCALLVIGAYPAAPRVSAH